MKQGLSLRVSQHLALTPQLQQSIRLLQLSTLELSQEIEQMLDDNPFLEKEMEDLAPREDFGLDKQDAVAASSDSDNDTDTWDGPMDRVSEVRVETASEAPDAPLDAAGVAESWDGDGSVEFSPDDSEWGGDAPAHNQNSNDDEKAQATELARNQESLTAFLHRQALSLRLDDTDRAALRFLIESLNDDGYLEDSFQSLAESLAGDDLEQCEELMHRFQVALGLLQSLEPTGVGARDLGECLRLQLQAIPADTEERAAVRACALAICKQPLELLAKRDVKRLVPAIGASELEVKVAMALIARLEPKPGRRFVDVERNVVVPDVLVTASGLDKQGLPQFRAMLNPEVMPRLKVNDIYANALKGSKGDSHAGLQQRLQEARWMIKNIQQRHHAATKKFFHSR
jgi:RNA polymerase sigma-54 factor